MADERRGAGGVRPPVYRGAAGPGGFFRVARGRADVAGRGFLSQSRRAATEICRRQNNFQRVADERHVT